MTEIILETVLARCQRGDDGARIRRARPWLHCSDKRIARKIHLGLLFQTGLLFRSAPLHIEA